jgi:nitrile hydratase accessory protein
MGAASTPFDHPSFANPWSLRAFGVTLAAAEAGLFTLQEFQQSLIAQIRAYEAAGHSIDSDESYYVRWIEALVELLRSKNMLADGALQSAEDAVRKALRALQHDHDLDHEPIRPMPLFVEPAR